MKSTIIRRGRPKKVRVEGEVVVKKPQVSTARRNRVYHFKDGPPCLVVYGKQKFKPEVITFGEPNNLK
jgi:hypothetical protein